MIEAVLVALVVAVGGIAGQWLLRRQDFRRQDQVADRVAETAAALLADNSKVTAKLDQIHELVNSNMTAAIRGELVAVEAQQFLARRLALLEPRPDDAGVLDALEVKIGELRVALADRAVQLVHADEAAGAAPPPPR